MLVLLVFVSTSLLVAGADGRLAVLGAEKESVGCFNLREICGVDGCLVFLLLLAAFVFSVVKGFLNFPLDQYD